MKNDSFIIVQVNLHIQPGDQVNEQTVTHAALTKKERVTAHKDNTLFGVPYYGMSMPIIYDDLMHGCVTIIRPSHQQCTEMASLAIRTTDWWHMVPFEDVVYVEAQSRKTIVHTCSIEGTHKLIHYATECIVTCIFYALPSFVSGEY